MFVLDNQCDRPTTLCKALKDWLRGGRRGSEHPVLIVFNRFSALCASVARRPGKENARRYSAAEPDFGSRKIDPNLTSREALFDHFAQKIAVFAHRRPHMPWAAEVLKFAQYEENLPGPTGKRCQVTRVSESREALSCDCYKG